jgi:hypothetical protein
MNKLMCCCGPMSEIGDYDIILGALTIGVMVYVIYWFTDRDDDDDRMIKGSHGM